MTNPTAYEILGVTGDVDATELKRAYRRRLRAAHPDLGGTAEQFRRVQWAWSIVGTAVERARYDEELRHGSAARADRRTAAAPPHSRPTAARTGAGAADAVPQPRSHGHPGGMHREAYMDAVRAWVGLGGEVDPFDPDLVRRLPDEVRALLTKAIAEETTVRIASALGSAFTLFNAVRVTGRGEPEVIDHLILGPTGVFLVLSAPWSGPVRLDAGEVVGEEIGRRTRPVRLLDRAAKWVAHGPGVRVAAIVIVVRDDAVDRARTVARRRLRPSLVLVRRSDLVDLLRSGVDGEALLDAEQVFEVRDVLQRELTYR